KVGQLPSYRPFLRWKCLRYVQRFGHCDGTNDRVCADFPQTNLQVVQVRLGYRGERILKAVCPGRPSDSHSLDEKNESTDAEAAESREEISDNDQDDNHKVVGNDEE